MKSAFIAIMALILAMLIWGSSFVALKIAFVDYHPLLAIWGRMTLASLMFICLCGSLRKIKYQSGDWALLLLMAFFEPCLYFVCEGYALTYTSAAQAGMITAMLPLFVAVAAFFYLQERVALPTWLGFILAIIGVCILSLTGKADIRNASSPILGNFLECLAMCCATGYTIILKKLSQRYPPLFLTAVQSVCGMIFFTPVLIWPEIHFPKQLWTTSTVAILYLGLVVTLGGYGMYNFGVSRLPASKASAFVNMIPVVTILMSWAVLGEVFTGTQLIGATLVFVGIFISQRGPNVGNS